MESEVGKNMNVRIILITLFVISTLAGCTTPTKFDVPESESATLKNAYEERGDSNYSLIFKALNGTPLEPGDWTAPVKAKFNVPAGPSNLALRVVYLPKKESFFSVEKAFEAFVFVQANLVRGETYKIDVEVVKGIATVWVKDSTGKRISAKETKGLLPIRRSIMIPIIIPAN